MFTDDAYAEDLSYLATYVRDDWLGLSVVTGTAAKLLGDDYDPDQERALSLRIIADLLDLGAQVGDLSADPERPFVSWESDKEHTLARIDAQWQALGHSPESGDICWITAD
jgi:hypothetical protein